METVERLSVQEMLGAKGMWSEIFFEDSERFTDYYFREKMPDNTGYGLKGKGGLRAMLFLTPYTGRILSPDRQGNRFRDIPLSYIVGVGTRKEYRHRGYMDRLLKRALADLHGEGQPFTFLMPADPAIYTPYQFRYIYERPDFSVLKREEIRAEAMESGEEGALAAFAQEESERRFQLFLKRDAAYYRRQKKESLAQNGDVFLWKENGSIAGFYLYAKENEKEEIQEAMTTERFAKRGTLSVSERTKPIIMARITNVPAMLSLMRLSEQAKEEAVTLRLQTQDPLLPGNNGTFLWTVGKKESTIALLEEGEADIRMEIDVLAEFLFGKRDGDSVVQSCRKEGGSGNEAGICRKLSCIDVLFRVCINEIV